MNVGFKKVLKKFKNYATRIYVWTTKQNNLTYILSEYILYWILFISPYTLCE